MNDSKKLDDLLMQLESLLRENGDSNWVRGVVAARNCLLDEEDGFDAAARSYRSMNAGMGSFGDFYIHHDDFEARVRLNRPLDQLRDDISKLIYWNFLEVLRLKNVGFNK